MFCTTLLCFHVYKRHFFRVSPVKKVRMVTLPSKRVVTPVTGMNTPVTRTKPLTRSVGFQTRKCLALPKRRSRGDMCNM